MIKANNIHVGFVSEPGLTLLHVGIERAFHGDYIAVLPSPKASIVGPARLSGRQW
jgi:hypothetical protein